MLIISTTLCISQTAPIVYVDTDGSGDYNCDGTDDHVQINQALAFVGNTAGYYTVHLNSSTYWIDATLNMYEDTTLQGDSDAEIKLIDEAGWNRNIPLIANEPGSSNNFTIHGFEIDGNSENQSVSRGDTFYNMMYFHNCFNITVTNMRLEWGTCDGLKVECIAPYIGTSAYITFTNNSVYKLGHDVLYVKRLNNVTVAHNDVFTRTNSAFRLSNSGNAKIYNNTIHSEIAGWSTGPGIELDKSTGYISENVEIYNNTFYTLNGAGIWIVGIDTDDVIRGKDVHIHHNIFYNVGQYWSDTGYSNAAIIIGQFNNTIVENNVIDDGGHAGIKYYVYSDMDASFTTTVRNNIIMNCDNNVAVGIWNYDDSKHEFISENNCIYGNTGGAYSGTNIITTNDIHINPLFADPSNYDYHLKSAAGRCSNNGWINDDATSPLIDAGYPTSDYSNEPEPRGNRINIGRYGNTAEASMSVSDSKSVSDQPTATAGPDQTVTTGDTVTLDGSASTDDIGIESYVWDFDDSNGLQQDATGAAVQHTYNTAGTYTATLTVSDVDGNADSDTVAIIVNEGYITPTPNGTSSSIYDNRLHETSPDAVIPDNDYVDIGHSTDVGRYRDVIWFNLSMYNTTDTISNATLSLYWYYPVNSTRNNDTVVEIYRPVDWDPDYVSWNHRTSDTPWNTPGGDWFDKNEVAQGSVSYASVTFSGSDVPDNRYNEFDVTELVQDYISGEYENTGFFLKAQDEYDNYIAFYSSDWSNVDQRPKLTVTLNLEM